jgi:hypothetical protein
MSIPRENFSLFASPGYMSYQMGQQGKMSKYLPLLPQSTLSRNLLRTLISDPAL